MKKESIVQRSRNYLINVRFYILINIPSNQLLEAKLTFLVQRKEEEKKLTKIFFLYGDEALYPPPSQWHCH